MPTVNVALLFCCLVVCSLDAKAHPLDENVILDIEQGQRSLVQEDIQQEREAAERRKRIRIIQAMPIWQRFAYFTKQGITHIIPLGLDHVLFVIGLALLSTNFIALLTMVSAFTLAHSITLMALILQWIPALPWIEIFIATSIIYVGVESKFKPFAGTKIRLLVTIVFGLIHGIGYAGALANIGFNAQTLWSSLLAFNLGIEIAQVSVILIYLLIMYAIKAKLSLYTQVRNTLAIGICVGGLGYLYAAILAILSVA